MSPDTAWLEQVLNNLSTGVIARDADGFVFFVNQAALQIIGCRKSDLVGRPCRRSFAGQPLCGGSCRNVCGQPRCLINEEYLIDAPGAGRGSRRVNVSVTTLTDDTGSYVGLVMTPDSGIKAGDMPSRQQEASGFAGIVGRDPKMLEVFQQIRRLKGHDYPVHVSGETGTGKELVAWAIHEQSTRANGPFVPINCGALPEGILESELFGHVKGSFSGAIRDKKGRFELAHGGSIFLDEVTDLPKSAQVKLLRILQDGKLQRVGGEKTIEVDVRVISASNVDLRRAMGRGLFREDLYYRLNVVPVCLPPLRERKGDIALLAEHFLKQAAGHLGSQCRLSDQTLSAMADYRWPGNVRQLENAIHHALVKCGSGGVIRPGHLPEEIRKPEMAAGPRGKLTSEAIKTALGTTGGNKAKAARLLGVGRSTLYRCMDSV